MPIKTVISDSNILTQICIIVETDFNTFLTNEKISSQNWLKHKNWVKNISL